MNANVKYDENCKLDPKKLPDPQKTSKPVVEGIGIQKVGINEFMAPIKYMLRDGGTIKQPTTISAYVSLTPEFKGINMSRLPRTIYEYIEEDISIDAMKNILKDFQTKCDAKDSYLKFKFQFPYWQKSLRSGLGGWQYYDSVLEGKMTEGNFRTYLTIDFTYSSTCPCSDELARNAEEERGVKAIAHSQRSVAKVTIEFDPNNPVFVEDLIDMLRDALKTETQVIVKREDEREFAIKSGEYPKFVEDASRLVYDKLMKESKIVDFVSVHVHKESLHSSNALAIIRKGIPGGLQ